MENIYNYLKTVSCFKKVELTVCNTIIINTGCYYSDKKEVILFINYLDNNFILTDNGRTRQFMDKIYELKEPGVKSPIVHVTEYYGISTNNQELSVKIRNTEEFIQAYLKMIYCISFLDSMRIFFV